MLYGSCNKHMSENIEVNGEKHEFQAEIQKLLQIIIHSLYQNREIFIRELVSNSSDAINKLRFEQLTNQNIYDKEAALRIDISYDEKAKTLTISDTGIGMTKDELMKNLGTIANSGSLKFLENLKNQQNGNGEAPPADLDIIGQFGVGFYSVFMVANKVVVRSRSFKIDASAAEWESEGVGTYVVRDSEKDTRGTDIIIYLKDEDATEYLSEYKIKNIITKYSDYVPFPIFVQGKEEAVNKQESLWRRDPESITDEEYEKFYQHVSGAYDKPSYRINYSIDAPIQFKTILFFPDKKNRNLFMPEPEWGLKLYSHNVLIQEKSKDLMPIYFRFIKGVVDSEDIPLNVSRETVQLNKILERIKKSLTNKIISEISKMSKKEADQYKKFWEEFGVFIKEGIASDQTNRDKLSKLLRFKSSKLADNEYTSLQDYISRMKDGQENIFYLLGDNLDVVKKSPHLEYYKSNDLEVLYLPEAIDGFVMMNLRDFEGKKFSSIDQSSPEDDKKSDDKKEEKKDDEKDDFDRLVDRFKEVLGEKVEDVRFTDRLKESPIRLVNPKSGLGSEMQRVYKAMDENFELSKKIVEVNKDHEIIKGLSSLYKGNKESELVTIAIEQLFENSLLQEGFHPKPGSMVPRINQIIEAAVRK